MSRMQNLKISLLAVFSIAIALSTAADVVMPDKFYTWVKNPNSAEGAVTKNRSGYFDTGVPARTGIEVEMDFQCDGTLYKNSYDKGLAAWNASGTKDLVAPVVLNPGTTETKDACICMGYGHNVADYSTGGRLVGATPFALNKNGRYQVHVRMCDGEQWLDARQYGAADYTRVVTSALTGTYDAQTTLHLFALSRSGVAKQGTPIKMYSLKIYTVVGSGTSAQRTLIRDYAACSVDGKPGLYDFVNGTITDYGIIQEGGGVILSTEEVVRTNVLMVVAEPEICRSVSPGNGAMSDLTPDYTQTFVAPEGVVQVNESTKATCAGWKLYEYNGETKAWDLKEESTSRTCTYSHSGAENVRRLVWQWNEVTTYAVSATTDEPGAVVTASKSQASPGEVVTFSATAPANRVFWKWTGDVPTDKTYDSTFSMAITSVTAVVAHFADRVQVAVGGDIQAALNGAADGSVIELAAGDYPLTATLAVSGGKRLYGAGRDQTRLVLNGSLTDKNYIISLSGSHTVITGLTLTATGKSLDYLCKGGLMMTDGTFSDGRITGLYSKQTSQGTGVNMTGGLLLRTEVTDCYAYSTGGSSAGPGGVYMTGGVVQDCEILRNEVDNSTHISGHGAGLKITDGLVTNTLVAWNREVYRTSGVAATGGTLVDCTIVSNLVDSAEQWGGVYNDGADFIRCTIAANRSFGGEVCYNVRKGYAGTFTDCTIGDESHPGTPTIISVSTVEALNAAVAGACDGSVITLTAGTYSLENTLYLTNAVTLVGQGDVKVTATKYVRPFFLRNPKAVLKNLTIADCKQPAVTILDGGMVTGCCFRANHAAEAGSALHLWVSGTVAESSFVDNGNNNDAGRDIDGGAVRYEGRSGVFDRCSFVSNYISAAKLDSSRFRRGSAMNVQGVVRLRSCLFARNYFNNSHGGGTITFENTDKWTRDSEYSQMENCTIADNSTAAARTLDEFQDDVVAGVALNDSARVKGVNCIIDGNIDYAGSVSNVFVRTGTTFNLTYSQVDAGSSVIGGEGNISDDPQFKDRAANCYKLSSGSPCIDAGTNDTWMATAVDLARKPRLSGKRVDMGAYEWSHNGLMLLVR